MKCSAKKRNRLPCTFKAKVNRRCGIHKLSKPTPKPRGIALQGVGWPTPKPSVKKTAIVRPVPQPRTKQRPIPPRRKKKPADQPTQSNIFFRE